LKWQKIRTICGSHLPGASQAFLDCQSRSRDHGRTLIPEMSNHFYRWTRYEVLTNRSHKTRVFYEDTSNCQGFLSTLLLSSCRFFPLLFSRALVEARKREEKREEREKGSFCTCTWWWCIGGRSRRLVYRSIAWQRGTDNVALWSLTPTWLRNIRENVETERWNILRNIISRTRVSLSTSSHASRKAFLRETPPTLERN